MKKGTPEDIIKGATTVVEFNRSITDRFAPLTDEQLSEELAHIDVMETVLDQLEDKEVLPLNVETVIGMARIIRTLRIKNQDMWKTSPEKDYDTAIHHNPDAKAWADFFTETFPNLADKHDLMLGWFANAMMAMHDHLLVEQSRKHLLLESDKWLCEWAKDKFSSAGRYKGEVYGNTDWALARALQTALVAALRKGVPDIFNPEYPKNVAPHIEQHGEGIFVWYDEAALEGGITSTLEEAKAQLKAYGEQLSKGEESNES